MSENAFWPPTGVFGPIITPATVRAAARDTLQTWSATYIGEVARQQGFELSPIQDWKVRQQYRTLPVGESPACWVTGLGTLTKPQRKGDGTYLVTWGVEVDLLIWGDDFENTEDLTGHYAAACVAALVQHGDLGGVAEATAWTGYRYAEVEHSSTRTLGVGRLTFAVTVDGVVNSAVGPTDPTQPVVVPPLVQTVTVNVQEQP